MGHDSLSKLALALQQALESALGEVDGERRAIMFSGGFDSMLMAHLARQRGAQVTAVTVQFEDFNPLTVAGSIRLAEEAGIAHHIIRVSAVEYLSAYEALERIMEDPYRDFDLGVVYAALKKYDPAVAGDVFISGMGSDQWFGDEDPGAEPQDMEARLAKAGQDVQDHQRLAQAHGYRFVFPFLSRPMLALSRTIPADMKKNKKLLRLLPAAGAIPPRTVKSELQVPWVMRNILIKKRTLYSCGKQA